MKFHSHKGKAQYQIDEAAFVPPIRCFSPQMYQWYLWKFFHEPPYTPQKQRCNTFLHGMSTPRG